MYEIPVQQAQFIGYDAARSLFTAEASDLGLPVGRFPSNIVYEGVYFMSPTMRYDREGELMFAEYTSGVATFRVYND